MEAHSGVQGFMTLSYNSHEDESSKCIKTFASQLRAEDRSSIALIEYAQDKDLDNESYESKKCIKYKIDAVKLVSLIKEYGTVEEQF